MVGAAARLVATTLRQQLCRVRLLTMQQQTQNELLGARSIVLAP